jgi:hypothetical protein
MKTSHPHIAHQSDKCALFLGLKICKGTQDHGRRDLSSVTNIKSTTIRLHGRSDIKKKSLKVFFLHNNDFLSRKMLMNRISPSSENFKNYFFLPICGPHKLQFCGRRFHP